MTIKSIHYVQECALKTGEHALEFDLYFFSTGAFTLIKQSDNVTPEMILGRLPADKFFEFNNLINREVFHAKMPELFGQNVITPKTKRLERMSLECSYDNEEKTEKN